MDKIDSYIVWTAIITPMNADGSIDYESFESLLRTQDSSDNAIFILGSTGEGLNIGEPEKKDILDFALKLKLNVPIITGVGGANLQEQLAWVDYLNGLDLDGYVLLTPVYAKPGIHGQYGWFKALLDTSKKPCMLYNIPGRTAKKLEFETAKMLKDHKNFWAMKEASGSTDDFQKYMEAVPGKLLLSGDDLMLPAFAPLGAKGVVSVLSNVWPEETREYTRQCLDGSFTGHKVWKDAISALFSASNPIPVKALLHDQGKIKSSTLRLPLSVKDMPDIEIVRKADKEITAWFRAVS